MNTRNRLSGVKPISRPISPVTRWGIAVAGVIMQIALGAVYAWSVFRIPLTKAFGWTISQVTFTFTIAILMLGFAAFVGGLWMRRSGPRIVAIAAGIFYGAGVFLASFSGGHLYWLYFSYGFLGGIGFGLGYIVPVATLVKWFPDKKGHNHGNCGGRVWSGSAHYGANREPADRQRRRVKDFCDSWDRLFSGSDNSRLLHERSASRICACRMAAFGGTNQGESSARLYAWSRAREMAVVRALGAQKHAEGCHWQAQFRRHESLGYSCGKRG